MSLGQALAEISRWAVVIMVLFAIQLVVPPLTVLLLRWRFPRFNPAVIGGTTGALLGLVHGSICSGCYFIWQEPTDPHWIFVGWDTGLTALYGIIIGLTVITWKHRKESFAAPAA
jgi:hypothetical protein